jgi:hypothetical protein
LGIELIFSQPALLGDTKVYEKIEALNLSIGIKNQKN